MPNSPDVHPDSAAGGAGPGVSKTPKPLGLNPESDRWDSTRRPLGRDPLSPPVLASAGAALATPLPTDATKEEDKKETDSEIEGLDLSDTAKKAAYELKKKHPSVSFTSGRRDKNDQARAMAENVVANRNWIKETYVQSDARDACQKWVDENKDKKTKDEIAVGLKAVLDGLTADQLGRLSKHLSGDAFDVQPVEKDADEIKKTIRALPGLSKFLEKEGGLVRWHAQF